MLTSGIILAINKRETLKPLGIHLVRPIRK